MEEEVTQDEAIVIVGEGTIQRAALLALRGRLGLEIGGGMPWSNRGPSTSAIANRITGNTKRTKKAAYEALDAFMVENGMESKPCPEPRR